MGEISMMEELGWNKCKLSVVWNLHSLGVTFTRIQSFMFEHEFVRLLRSLKAVPVLLSEFFLMYLPGFLYSPDILHTTTHISIIFPNAHKLKEDNIQMLIKFTAGENTLKKQKKHWEKN